MPKKPRSHAAHTPMRGAALSRLATAFRLWQRVQRANGLAEGTARAGLSDQRDIARHRHLAMVRAGVDALFTTECLQARGLTAADAVDHNDLVTHAVEAVLMLWDQHAAYTNITGAQPAFLPELRQIVTGYSTELSLRLAAFEALYGHLHAGALLHELPSWLGGKGISGWWTSVTERAEKKIVLSGFEEGGSLHRKTIREIRDGKALPNEGNVVLLAERLAAHRIRRRPGDEVKAPLQTYAELELELRIAVAVAEHPTVARYYFAPPPSGAVATHFHQLRTILADAPDDVLASLLRDGMGSPFWTHVHARFAALVGADVLRHSADIQREAERNEELMRRKPAARHEGLRQAIGRESRVFSCAQH